MQFLVLGYDGNDGGALERRLAVRDAHIALGNELRDEGKLLYGVAMLNDSQIMIGSCLICEFESRSALDSWLEVEPYVTGDVWRRTEVMPYKVGPSFVNMKLVDP